MAYELNRVDEDVIISSYKDYEYILMYGISEVNLLKVSDAESIDWNECLEARLFSNDCELHVINEDGKLTGYKINETSDENTMIKKYQLASKFTKYGKSLCVKEYLAYDEDGQISIELTRLEGIM